MDAVYSIDKLLTETRKLAAQYRKATGSALPVTSELAVHDACRLLDLTVEKNKAQGVDAIDNNNQKIQIKGRAIFDESKSGHRIGKIALDGEWDSMILVLFDDEYDPFEIYQATREDIEAALNETKDSKRNKRGMMSVARFKVIGEAVWFRE